MTSTTTPKDYFYKKSHNSHTHSKQTKGGNGILIIILFVLLIAFIAFAIYHVQSKNLDIITSQNKTQTSTLSLGQDISINGTIQSNGDIITHTHTITATDGQIYAVKSSTINLGNYQGTVQANGKVEKFYKETPIIEIYSVSGELVDTPDTTSGDTDVVLDTNAGIYIAQGGIQLLHSFFDDFLLTNDGENGEIKFEELDTHNEYSINYFRCSTTNPDKNCKNLLATFSQGSPRSFTTSNGDTYYKSSFTNQRFVANGDRRGIMINDIPEETVMKLKDEIVFANSKIMKDRTNFAAPSICKKDGEKLVSITKTDFTIKQEGLIANIIGKSDKHEISCSIQVNFSLPNKGTLISFTVGKEISPEQTSTGQETIPTTTSSGTKIDQNTDSTPDNSTQTVLSEASRNPRNPNTPQFPINLDKTLSYKSTNRGYEAIFPSSNISFSASIISETFDQSGLKCSNVINVIKYDNKAELETNPALRIYECTSKGDITSPGENYLIVSGADRTFIIQINDSAWINFANNIKFNSISS